VYNLRQTACKDIEKYAKKIKYTLRATANDYAGTKGLGRKSWNVTAEVKCKLYGDVPH